MIVGGAALSRRTGSRPSTSARSRSAQSSRSGRLGLLLALVGILFAVGGASIDTVFSGAYNLAQFCGWEWGRYRHPRGAPRFALTWLVLLVLALGDRDDRRRPGNADRVRGDLLGRRAPADLHPDPARRERHARTWAATERPTREHARNRLSRRDPGRRARRDPADAPDERRARIDAPSRSIIGLHVLDHQLLDKDGRRCGNVDDLAIEGGAGEVAGGRRDPRRPRLLAAASGLDRPARRLDRWLDRGSASPGARSTSVDSAVELKHEATELGLGRGDDRLRPFLEKIPGADR